MIKPMDPADSVHALAFLESAPGKAVLKRLREDRPPILGKGLEEAAMSGKFAQGWEECIDHLIALAEARPQGEDAPEYKDTATD
jgi:hypothetical protein